MNIRDLHDHDFGGDEPPSTDLFAGEYVLGVPLVAEASVRIGDARLRIRREPRDIATLDGRALPRTAAPHTALAAGGMLRLGPAR